MALIKELRVLSENIGYFHELGIWIDWDAIKIHHLPNRKLQHVVLNQSGDYVLLALPYLSKTPALLDRTIPWLRARAEDRRYEQLFPRADQLISAR